jgi:mannose-1-phosphate guanylyltransferase/mannose-6-phosphate isomerase
MSISPIILSGGSGTRLWPSSRKSLPKQFIDFPSIGSLFARTLERANAIKGAKNPIIISSKEHGFLCRDAVSKLGLETRYIFEEIGRNTGPAIYMAALACNSNDTLLIMPSDHWIDDSEGFASMAAAGEEVAADRGWITFGITPSTPATGYGYINANNHTDGVMKVLSFTEKPDLTTAKAYLEQGGYFWNSGIFMVKADTCIESFRRYAPDLASAADACWQERVTLDDETTLPKLALESVPSVSVDYAILEKEDKISLMPFSGGWSDVGNWDNLSALIETHKPQSIDCVSAVTVDAPNTFIHSRSRTIAAVGVENLIIVDDDDATLIVAKGASEKVKSVVEKLKDLGNKSAIEHSFEYRPWGMFENLLDNDICKVKRIIVDPGHHLSLQYHHKRSEHWIVVAGTATVQLEGDFHTLVPGQAIDIPLGSHHALGNDTDKPVIVIEVQMGSYFGEDDIVRVSDPYRR